MAFPLHTIASAKGDNVAGAQRILSRGANALTRDGNNALALHLACAFGNTAIASMLLSIAPQTVNEWANPNEPVTALHLAVYYGNVECVRLLLERGADPLLRDGLGRRPVDLLVDNTDHTIDATPTQRGAMAMLLAHYTTSIGGCCVIQ